MNKILGIFGLLLFVGVVTSVLSSSFDTEYNMYNVARWSATFGIISIGAAFVIITGGIDLSVGSLISLSGCILVISIKEWGLSVYSGVALVMAFSMLVGLFHGLLITKLKLQPFVVTLYGFLVYRGLARWFGSDQPQGFGSDHREGLRQLAIGKPWVGYEANMAVLLAVAGVISALYFAYQVVFRMLKSADGRMTSLVGLIFSLLAATIGMSQFIGGTETLVMKVAGQSIPLEPASLLFWVGLLIFVPSAIWLATQGLMYDSKKCLPPVIFLAIAAIAFAYVAFKIAPTFEQIETGDSELRKLGVFELKGKDLRNLIMLFVLATTGALMGAISWMGNTVSKLSESTRPVLFAVVASGVMWLIGMTKLPSTAIPMPLLILIGCAIVASIFLNQTIFGRYLLALGRNEEAAPL